MKLPNAHQAIVDIAKLSEYCLNPEHPKGRHKARAFASTLGFTANDAEKLKALLLWAAQECEALLTGRDDYGDRYVVDFRLKGLAGAVSIRSCWIVRMGEENPRLASCYVSGGRRWKRR